MLSLEQPIQALMKTTLENIKDMIDVSTVIGEPVETLNGTVIFPISKVGFGFVSGGGDLSFCGGSKDSNGNDSTSESKEPFAGGSGAGVSVHPVGFLSVSNDIIRMIPVSSNTVLDRVMDLIPDLLDNLCNCKKIKKEG